MLKLRCRRSCHRASKTCAIIALKRRLQQSEKEKHQILISEFGESNIQRQFSISGRDPDQQQERKISKCTAARPKMCRVGMRSKNILQSMDQINVTKSSSRRKDTEQTSSETEATYTATGLAIHSKERMCIFDSGAALRMMGLSSLNL